MRFRHSASFGKRVLSLRPIRAGAGRFTVLVDELAFDFLDDLALGVARRRAQPEEHLALRTANRIGPLVELLALDRVGLMPMRSLRTCDAGQLLARAILNSHVSLGIHGTRDGGARIGLVLTNRDASSEEQTHWLAFCRRAHEAAELSLPKPIAQGLIGALREIEENVHRHSERSYDGIVGYRGTDNEFESVVAG